MKEKTIGGNKGWLVPDDKVPHFFVTYRPQWEKVRIQRVFKKKKGLIEFQQQKIREFERKKGRYQVGFTLPFDIIEDLREVLSMIHKLHSGEQSNLLSDSDKLEQDIKKFGV